ncbi:DinB family protein [Flavivirga amylovorans]|uniref:DinB family protein n=1 Tax=Flavivirga amylovorans TaxID=870486 RepID=A0ABT8X588_9FLAO|nr:DinB family protein [Flavivirga amylovorans]MDO5988719.1 DinB family protein [Flavivirga amylovorans]
MKTSDLKTTEYNEYYYRYINLISKETTLIDGFKKDSDIVLEFFESIPSDKLDYRYAEGKWSVKEIFQHLIDTERIFQHRCFRFSRHDKTVISGFEQDDYIEPSCANDKSLESLIEEFKAVRQSFIVLLKSLEENDLKFIGNASGLDMSARAAAFTILGHSIWHIKVINERYL